MAPHLREPTGLRDGGCERPDLALVLPLWAELDGQRRRALYEHAGRCLECGPKLELLRRADEWLENQVRRTPAGICPAPEQLYDYGNGPGAQGASDAERLSLKAHLATCEDCATFVVTLGQRPPSPLLLEGEPRPAAERPDRARRLAILAPLAAAAAVVTVLLWDGGTRRLRIAADDLADASSVQYPSDPPLRGRTPGDLWFPRERLLATEAGLWSELRFEIAEVERASLYRIVLERNEGGAFDEGEFVADFESAGPVLAPGLQLSPGHYTWEAWAIVDGLAVVLGSRDFEVVHDPEMLERIAERDTAPDPSRSEAILHLLHDSGFTADARAVARRLPPSPGRESYLGRTPER
jgi:hypothetical protein